MVHINRVGFGRLILGESLEPLRAAFDTMMQGDYTNQTIVQTFENQYGLDVAVDTYTPSTAQSEDEALLNFTLVPIEALDRPQHAVSGRALAQLGDKNQDIGDHHITRRFIQDTWSQIYPVLSATEGRNPVLEEPSHRIPSSLTGPLLDWANLRLSFKNSLLFLSSLALEAFGPFPTTAPD